MRAASSLNRADVVTGAGALALEAAAGGAAVLAADFSPGMVNRVAVRPAEGGFDKAGCEARVMGGQALRGKASDQPCNRLSRALVALGQV